MPKRRIKAKAEVPKPSNNIPPKNEQRSPDQDAAIEKAFVAATLPEEDRRAIEEHSSVHDLTTKSVPETKIVDGAIQFEPKMAETVPPSNVPPSLYDPKHWES